MPKSGVFESQYLCAPEERKWQIRKDLCATYGFFDMQVEESEVLWWTGLGEVTEDVLDWLEFCIGNFPSMQAAFTAIDGPDGNGVISLREFEEAVDEVKCTKFDGPNKKERVGALFRYLDPGGEGSVSEDEW